MRQIKSNQSTTATNRYESSQIFHGLCNFFRMHIKNFATVSAPLTKLTSKDSGYNSGPLPKKALDAFLKLKKRLMTDPVVAYPRSNQKYVLITAASTKQTKLQEDLEQFSLKGLSEVVNSIDPFSPDLQQLQLADERLIKINSFQKDGKWLLNTSKSEQRLLLPLTNSLFLDSKAVWIRLNDKNYPRWHFGYQKFTARKLFVKSTERFCQDTMP
jgi:hypothetical protein